MSDGLGMTMEEAEEAEENELLGGEEDEGPGDSGVTDDIDETAEDLMTDMKLDDESDEIRATEPDFFWTYHIEIYPWNAEDMTENFVRLLKLAEFSQIFMRKKGTCKENGEPESLDDKLHDRQRKGSIHFYTDNFQNAKNIIRSATWKAMVTKQLTFEITKRGAGSSRVESAYLEVDTYTACKCRFRDRPKGEFKDRTAKVSHIPGSISREFLDVVFCRAYAVIGGSSVQEYYKERDGKLQQKLSQIKDFDGSLDFDCLSRGSCRAFVTAHKNVYIEGQRITIVANSEETMVVPAPTNNLTNETKKERLEPALSNSTSPSKEPEVEQTIIKVHSPWASRPRGIQAGRGILTGQLQQAGRGSVFREPGGTVTSVRGRSLGRATLLPQRPASATVSRPGPGMPVPMTGRQKMNEKMRRSNLSLTSGPPTVGGLYSAAGAPYGPRNVVPASLGESFKQEIASLQDQLQKNTAELEAKIAMLQESTRSVGLYGAELGDWDEGGFAEEDDYYDADTSGGQDMGYNNSEIQGLYQCGPRDFTGSLGTAGHHQNMLGSSAGGGMQGMLPASGMAATGMMSVGPFLATQGGPMQMAQSMPGQITQPMSGQMTHTTPEQMSQSMQGHMRPNVPRHMPHSFQGQLSGQMPQPMSMQGPQPLLGHMPLSMSGHMTQSTPGQMRQPLQGQMPQPMPAQMIQPAPTQMPQNMRGQRLIGPQRGGVSSQSMRGLMRGRGRMREMAPGPGYSW